MEISLVSNKVYQKYKDYSRVYPSRRAAFRDAKREGNIPMTMHPQKVLRPFTEDAKDIYLDDRNVRLYVFRLIVCAFVVEYHIREDKKAFYGSGEGDQLDHFNSGESSEKLKNHHYWDDKR